MVIKRLNKGIPLLVASLRRRRRGLLGSTYLVPPIVPAYELGAWQDQGLETSRATQVDQTKVA
jgi:hypothetical protein